MHLLQCCNEAIATVPVAAMRFKIAVLCKLAHITLGVVAAKPNSEMISSVVISCLSVISFKCHYSPLTLSIFV